MRLLSFPLWFASITIQFSNATSLHASPLSRNDLQAVQSNKAHSNDDQISVGSFYVRMMESLGRAATSASNEDVHSSLTLVDSLSRLDRWGSHAPHHLPHLSQTHESLSAHLHQAKSVSSVGESGGKFLLVALLITGLSIVCACFGRWWDEEEDIKGPDPTMAAVEACSGPWANAYRESHGQRREIIEMLFKCNIITMPEFANYGVSDQHSDIEQCVQIGMCMLEERRSSDWQVQWQEAQQTFEHMAEA